MKKTALLLFLSIPAFGATPSEVVDFQIRQSTMNVPLDGVAVVSVSPRSVRLDFGTGATQGQRDTAKSIAQNIDLSAASLAAFDTTRDRSAAFARLSAADPQAKLMKAVIAVMLDEINLVRTNASLPSRTAAQLKTAIQNKLTSGSAD